MEIHTRITVRQWTILLFIVLLFSCNDNKTSRTTVTEDSTATPIPQPPIDTTVTGSVVLRQYANARFREVTVEKIQENKFRVRGLGQLFEANLSWNVEDGHNVLKSGFATTDAGAPEWGKFDFTVDVQKARANSTLTLVLFEASARDGSPQHELPIRLN